MGSQDFGHVTHTIYGIIRVFWELFTSSKPMGGQDFDHVTPYMEKTRIESIIGVFQALETEISDFSSIFRGRKVVLGVKFD